jgi:hypothetical protein
MCHPSLSWLAGPLCLTASALIVLSQLLRLGVALVLGPGSASTVTHTVTYAVALLGMAVLLLALTPCIPCAHRFSARSAWPAT